MSSSTVGSDAELVGRILRDGDELAFEVLYERHAPAMFRFALRVTGGNRSDAEDVLQEAWVRGMERLGGFAGSSGLRTWLSGITLNAGRELLRRNSRAASPPPELSAHRGGRVGEGGPARIDMERILASLPEDWRLVLLLHDVEGYTHEEIAAWLEIRPGTSRSRLSRARARIREILTTEQAKESTP